MDDRRRANCAVVGVVPFGRQCCKPPEEHGCTRARSSCTGHHQWDEGSMFNFSNSLIIISPLLAFMASVASGHLWCPV